VDLLLIVTEPPQPILLYFSACHHRAGFSIKALSSHKSMLLFNVARICWKSANVKKFLPEGLLRYVLTQWWNWFLYVLGWIMKLVFFHYRSVKYFKQVLRVIY